MDQVFTRNEALVRAALGDALAGDVRRVGSSAIPGMPGTPVVDIDRLPVTAFRDYLQCPYRFWLKHVERLRAVEDALRIRIFRSVQRGHVDTMASFSYPLR